MQDFANMVDTSPNSQPSFQHRKGGATIAYRFTAGKSSDKSVGVVFLGGFRSDMEGTKAQALEQWCEHQGRPFLRFDYSGHGASSGSFEDGCIGDWAADAIFALDELTKGPQVLVGSSMGGWIMLLAALARPERVAGLLGLAAAPDFTEDLMWKELNDDQRATIMQNGHVVLACDYDPTEPYVITKKLIEDGQQNLLLNDVMNIKVPVRLIQGLKDNDVPWATALKIQSALVSDDVEVQLIKNGDHRLSETQDLLRLHNTLDTLLKDIEAS